MGQPASLPACHGKQNLVSGKPPGCGSWETMWWDTEDKDGQGGGRALLTQALCQQGLLVQAGKRKDHTPSTQTCNLTTPLARLWGSRLLTPELPPYPVHWQHDVRAITSEPAMNLWPISHRPGSQATQKITCSRKTKCPPPGAPFGSHLSLE